MGKPLSLLSAHRWRKRLTRKAGVLFEGTKSYKTKDIQILLLCDQMFGLLRDTRSACILPGTLLTSVCPRGQPGWAGPGNQDKKERLKTSWGGGKELSGTRDPYMIIVFKQWRMCGRPDTTSPGRGNSVLQGEESHTSRLQFGTRKGSGREEIP